MNRQVLIGFVAEGSTDERFLLSVIERVFQRLALREGTGQFDVLEPQYEAFPREQLTDYIRNAATEFADYYDILCIHCDADNRDDRAFRREVLRPALEAHAAKLREGQHLVPHIVPIVPVRTLENWMLADTAVLKREMATTLNDLTLGLQHPPESYTNPKATIGRAIRIDFEQGSGRRNMNKLTDLYQPIGENASLDELLKLPSFQKFYQAARQSLIDLGLIVPE